MTVDDFIVKDARAAVTVAREQGDRPAEARALFELGSILSGLGRSEEARSVSDQLAMIGRELVGPAEQGVLDARERGSRRAEANALFALGHVLRYAGRHDEASRATEQAKQCNRERIEQDNRERAETARQLAAQAIAAARERGDRRAEAEALRTLSYELGHADRHDEASRAAEQAGEISREMFEQDIRKRTERARQTAAQAVAAARERGDRQAEAEALRSLSYELVRIGRPEEASHAAEQADAITHEQRALERLESATHAVCDAQAQGDRAAEALALLTLGQALVVLERPTEAEPVFDQAEQLAHDLLDAMNRTAAEPPHHAARLKGLRTLIALEKALREAGRDNRGLAVSNSASDITAESVIQVGVVHGDLTVHTAPTRPGAALNISVTTRQAESAPYYYETGGGRPDIEVHVLVEAFTSQAVILRQLRPVVLRRIHEFNEIDARMSRFGREFRVGLDLPATRYDAGLDGQELNLDRASAAGAADFPFYVTASDPEYFVIRPEGHRDRSLIEWRLELDWSCLGQHGTLTIDHGDRPFLFASR